jgi:hypothetical protein
MERTRFHMIHVTSEYHQVCPKWFLSRWYVWRKLCTYLAPTLTLSPNRKKRDSQDWHHLWVPSGASKMISKPMVRSTQTMHLSCVKISTISEETELSHEPHLQWVPLGVSKTIFERMVHFSQTVHLSCTDTNTVYKRKEVRFHMMHVTYEYDRVHPKRFLCL